MNFKMETPDVGSRGQPKEQEQITVLASNKLLSKCGFL